MRALIELAVTRRVTVIMTALAVVAFGFVGYSRLTLELFPDITYPSLTVQTEFPDTAPEEVENLITRPVEEVVGVLSGLQGIHSVSRAGTSEVTLEFDWGSDMDVLSMEVREKLDRLILPEEAEDPIVLRFDPSLDPILRIALSGESNLTKLRDFAERKIKQDLETLEGVASAKVKGGYEEEIQIAIDQERLAALEISMAEVEQAVGISNVNLPGGALRGDEDRYLIRTINEYRSEEDIAELIIRHQEGASVKLKEVAQVYRGVKEREEITRVGKSESVELALYKEGDANTVQVAQRIRERLKRWEVDLPRNSKVTLLFDQSQFIEQAVNEVRDAALIGGLLAIIILFLFLRDLPSTVIIGTTLPISIIATFMVMYRADISLNIMSLGGLTLGVGMLVDNAIVVLESIHRKRESGLSRFKSAIEGATEVGPAVIASTLTTVAVFLPIIFVEGVAGQLFRDQALTVTISLIASLAVALTVIPMLGAVGNQKVKSSSPPVEADDQLALGWVSKLYGRFLRGALRWGIFVLLLAFGILFGTYYGFQRLDSELIPQMSEGEFFFEVNLPEGSSLKATDAVVQKMEAEGSQSPLVEKHYSTVGSRLVAGGISLNTEAENLGQVNFVLKDGIETEDTHKFIEALRASYEEIPDLEVKFGQPSYFSLKTPVEVICFGDELTILRDYSMDLVERLKQIPGLVDVRSSLEAGNPEVHVRFDRKRIASLGLRMDALSNALRSRVQGVVPTRFREVDRQIDIRVRNDELHRASIGDIRMLVVPGPDGLPIRLGAVADVRRGRGPAEIHRLQQQRAAVITANLQGRGLGDTIQAVRTELTQNPPHSGISVELGGQNKEMEVSFQSLLFAIGLAIFLVYLVMASTFESFLHPLIVLGTIPLSTVGVVLGLLLTDTKVSVIVLIGCILLVGIVVNNAIVLIDTINRFRRRGIDKMEAILRASQVRLRPILMTTITTIVGLLPMALGWGEGSELRSPLAVTVASGLFLSTLLTLVVIPVTYHLIPSKVSVFEDETQAKEDPS